MDRPPPDASKLLSAWMEWERGETPPGRVMSNLKTAGLRDLLQELAAAQPVPADPAPGGGPEDSGPATEVWKPVV